jgi:uncharacterized membrane protein
MKALESTVSQIAVPRSFFHRAADFAVFAIVFAFVVKFVSAQTPAPLGTWLSWTAESVGLLAIPAGAIALLGLRKFGARGLLWKGLLGVLVPIILFLAGIVVAVQLREHARKLMEQRSAN